MDKRKTGTIKFTTEYNEKDDEKDSMGEGGQMDKKTNSDLPTPLDCPKCRINDYHVWIWEGIRLYQCNNCLEFFTESEL
jgi:hypothetical protein